MKVLIVKDYEQMSRIAADIIADIVRRNPSAVLGLATGSTPVGMYKLLSQFVEEKKTSFKMVRTVNLDEYVGLGAEHEQSFAHFMRTHLFDSVDVAPNNTHIPNGLADDPQSECDRYHRLLQQLPQDVQVLGLGSNGHIGFNEPDTPFDSTTHTVRLAESTVRDNARFFASREEVPQTAITMGISEIMNARKIIVLASGKNKAQAVKAMVEGEVTPACPASVLQNHADCTVIVDEDAASLLAGNYR